MSEVKLVRFWNRKRRRWQSRYVYGRARPTLSSVQVRVDRLEAEVRSLRAMLETRK